MKRFNCVKFPFYFINLFAAFPPRGAAVAEMRNSPLPDLTARFAADCHTQFSAGGTTSFPFLVLLCYESNMPKVSAREILAKIVLIAAPGVTKSAFNHCRRSFVAGTQGES